MLQNVMASKYVHQRITSPRSIRVLTLLPSWSRKAPLRGTFAEHDLDLSTGTSFEALSYVWGKPENPGAITIVNHYFQRTKQSTAELTITSNCESALRRLRYRFQSRRLWVDAICIDQNSVLEKSEQVALMVEIYYKAKQVLVWLQVEDEEEARMREVSRLIKQIGWLYRKGYLWIEGNFRGQLNLPKETRFMQVVKETVVTEGQELIDAMYALFTNRYFRRIWTVQEIAMAHQITVHYGKARFTWADFVACVTFFVHDRDIVLFELPFKSLLEIFENQSQITHGLTTHFAYESGKTLEAFHDQQNKGSIVEKITHMTKSAILLRTRGLEATEPKDQAYAMMWAFPRSGSSDLNTPFRNVDYTKSIETIYTEYTIALLNAGADAIDVLLLVNSTPRNPSLPSWVPDYDENISSYALVSFQFLCSFKSSQSDYVTADNKNIELVGNSLLRAWGIEYSKIKVVIKQNRNDKLSSENSTAEQDLDAVKNLQFSRVLKDVIDAGRNLFGMNDDQLMKALDGAVRMQGGSMRVGIRDKDEITPTELQLTNRLGISNYTLKLRIFRLLTPLISHTARSPETQQVKESLRQLFPEETIDAAFRLAEQQEDVPFFLAVLAKLPVGNFWSESLLGYGTIFHSDKDFFITESGKIGLAYHGVQEGDLVTIWRGCPCPMIVRKRQANVMDAYHFHGPAYIDGIMNGEAWPETEDGLQEFILV